MKARDPQIAEGVRLFDAGRYDDAIARYREVLARNPNDVEALYELAYTYEAKRDWTAALETAKRGAAFESRLLPVLYVVIGNVYDEMGQSADAIAAYRSGINANPGIPLAAQAGHEAIDQLPAGKPAAGEGTADAPKRPRAVERVFESLSIAAEGERDDPKGFAETYYLRYFRGLKKQELLETAAYLACRSADVPEVGVWLKARAPKVEALRAWSASFKWSGPRKEP